MLLKRVGSKEKIYIPTYLALSLSLLYYFAPERSQCINQITSSQKTTGFSRIKIMIYISTLICLYNSRFSNNNRMSLHSKCFGILQQQSDDPAASSPSTETETSPKEINKTSYLIVIFIFLLFLSRQDMMKTPLMNNKTKRQPRQLMMKTKFLSR